VGVIAFKSYYVVWKPFGDIQCGVFPGWV